jgi:hypothetical protein
MDGANSGHCDQPLNWFICNERWVLPRSSFDNEQYIHMSSKNKLQGKQLQTQCEIDNPLILHYTKHDIQCHLLFEVTQCYIHSIDVNFLPSTCVRVL